jgi:hypothetical protein
LFQIVNEPEIQTLDALQTTKENTIGSVKSPFDHHI